MSNKNEVLEYLIDQLRQQVNKKDVTSFNVSVRISDLDEVKRVIHNLQQHIAGKDDEIRALKDSLRRQLPVVDVMGEIKRWSIDRSIAGRGNYTDEENAIIDAYIGLEHNPYKQQCEDLAHEVQSLKNQLRDASAQIKELHLALAQATGDVEAYKLMREQEQSGCRKEDTQAAEPWVKWEGGECPVDRGQQVDVIFRDGGSAGPLGASYFRWKHIGNMDDIIRYRVVTSGCKHDWEVRTYPGSDETYDYCPLCREVRQ